MKGETDPGARLRLTNLREALLDLHKTLIDSERVRYEQTFGPITSPANFLRLLTDDPWFAWLRPLSRFIAEIDELLDTEEPLSSGAAEQMSKAARAMLVPNETGEGFGREYFDALQRDPNVVMAHSGVMKLHRPPVA